MTATPQALFLQDAGHSYRPQFTVVIDPGQGYIGGETFFSLVGGVPNQYIRPIQQQELINLITSNGINIPDSLQRALCIFYVGATIKYLQRRNTTSNDARLRFSFLCHISQRRADHTSAFDAVNTFYNRLRDGLTNNDQAINQLLNSAYNDLLATLPTSPSIPSLQDVLSELQGFIVGSNIQILNSDSVDDLNYSRRYNIFIGGTRLARGVTIQNLLVTYYGRQANTTNMDTMLQHARMYGYRAADLDVTRLFVTQDVESRFRLISESEEALRECIRNNPNGGYEGIKIGGGVRATRSNVLNPNRVGAYVAGRSYFPRMPQFDRNNIQATTNRLDRLLAAICPSGTEPATQVSIDDLITYIRLTSSDQNGSGLWDDNRIITALESIKSRFNNIGYIVVRRNRRLTKTDPSPTEYLSAVLGPSDLRQLARTDYPTLFMYKVANHVTWNNTEFWIPVLRFPDGQYAIMFNFG